MEKTITKKKSFSVFYIILGIVLTVYAITMIYALSWGLLNSFKSKSDFRTNVLGLPSKWMWENYTMAFENLFVKIEDGLGFRTVYLSEMFLYSVLYAVGCALCTTACTCGTAYVVREFPCKFSSILYGIVIATMLIPIVGADASMLVVLNALGLYDTMIGSWFMKCAFLGMYFLVFYATFSKLSPAYREAAEIDGASNLRILLNISLPLIKSTFLTVFLLNFIGFWNDYQSPLLYMPSYPTISYGVYLFANSQLNELSSIPMKLTGCMLMLLPILIVFLLFSKRLMEGVSAGGVKE